MSTRLSVSIGLCLAIGAIVSIGCGQGGDTRPLDVKLREVLDKRTAQKPVVQYIAGEMPAPALDMREPYIRVFTTQETAADSLGRIGESAVPALIEAMQQPDPDVRMQATRALAVMGPAGKAAVPALAKLLQDPDDGVRRGAARALGQMGTAAKDAIPNLIELLEQHRANSAPAPLPPREG